MKKKTLVVKKKTASVAASKQSMKDVYYDPSQVEAFGGKPRIQKRFPRKQVDEWLPTQLTYSLHKPIRKNFQLEHIERLVLMILGKWTCWR